MDDIRDRFRRQNAGYREPQYGSRPAALPRQRPAPAPQPVEPPDDPPWIPDGGRPNRQTKPKGRHKKWFTLIVVLILLLAAGGAGAAYYLNKRDISGRLDPKGPLAPADPLPGQTEQPTATGTIRLVATGDMIAHDSINSNAKKPDGSYDYVRLMDKMKPYFNEADIRFCNQSTPAGGASFGYSGYPVFNAPIEFARGIEGVGCNLINIGTNHTNDKGQALIDATVKAWDDRGNILAVAGANRSEEEQKKPRTFEVQGMKFAFLSYTTYTNKPVANGYGVNMYNEAKAKAEIAAARKEADFVIVSMRWGTEYSPNVNAQQDKIAKSVVNAGADVILGHGPHAMQPVKRIKATDDREALVWFSLGNFLNSQLDIETLIGGFAVMDIDIAQKKITGVKFLPVYQHYEWTAAQASRQNGADLAARHDFTMVPLDEAADLLAKSHHKTTVKAQTDRVTKLLNKFTEIPIIRSEEY